MSAHLFRPGKWQRMKRRARGRSSSGTRERASSAGGPRAVGVSVAQHRQDFTHAHMLISVPLFCSYNKYCAAIVSTATASLTL